MDRDEVFEHALSALLAGEQVETALGDRPAGDGSLDAIRVLSAIGRTSKAVLFGAEAPEPAARRWGHLEIREEIGRGSSGTVYRSWDTRLAREVALKLLDPDSATTHAALAEGRLLARVRHPHIVTVYGADTFDGVSGLWMELVEGHSLDAVLERDGPMSVADGLQIGIDLASALAAVHAAEMLHRDVKARNVIRQRGGRLVLMDFGAGSGGERAEAADAVGTPLYMAPEVLEGGPASVRSDVYGLGVLLYHLITGSYPVAATDLSALEAAHRAPERRTLFVERPDLHAAARKVIERACAPDAADRYANARELEVALSDTLAVILADEARVVPASTRWWRRWRRVVLTTTGVAASVLLVTWLGWNTGAGRAARRLSGLPVPPRSPLYLTVGGAIGIVEGGRLSLLPGTDYGAYPLAVSEALGVRTLPGYPPWVRGTWFRPDGRPARAGGTLGGVCCFMDGTTDGLFNYALRQDSTLAEPVGSRPLAPPAIHRFTLEWTDPTVLFELGGATAGVTSGYYSGIAYAGAVDAFFVAHTSSDGRSVLEQWSRDGRRLAQWPLPYVTAGVAADPADETVWVLRYDMNARLMHITNLDSYGRALGSFEIAKPFASMGALGMEFAWPATK
jgi:serine/threonine-protein kinase